MMSFLGNAVSLIKQVVGQNFVGGSSPSTVIEIDQESVGLSPNVQYVVVQTDQHKNFLLLKEKTGSHHVCVVKNNGKFFSIYRDRNVTVATETFNRFAAENLLFTLCVLEGDFNALVEQLHKYPMWQSVHHASALGLEKFFDLQSGNPELKRIINIPSEPEGLFPLHVAAKFEKYHVIRKLLTLGADLSAVDSFGKTALHYATLGNAKTIGAFSNCPKLNDYLNKENLDGVTPLHLSVLNSKPDSVRALLKLGASPTVPYKGRTILFHLITAGQINPKNQECIRILLEFSANLLNVTDPSSGDTVFHVTTEVKNLSALLTFANSHANLDARNRNGDTPLMSQLKRANFNCFVKLLAYSADLDGKDANGNTPLHVAIEKGYLDFVKALLIFFADTSVQNKNGHNARHIASKSNTPAKPEILHCLDVIDAQYCAPGRTGCVPDCAFKSDAVKVSRSSCSVLQEFAQTLAVSQTLEKLKQHGSTKLDNILALDGGGIRGLLIIQILMCLEKRLNHHGHLIHKFSWVCGTSTGAIIAAALSCGRSLKECQKLYFRLKDDVFNGSTRPYDTMALENFLKREFGETKTLADVKHCKLIITSVIGNVFPMKLHLFRNFQLPHMSKTENRQLGYEEPSSQLLWKATRCSSAAPTYFSPVDNKYVDGGLIANNPTLDVLAEINNYNLALKMQNKSNESINIGSILSIGTGQTPQSSMNPLNLSAPNSIFEYISAALAVKDAGKILIHQVTDSEGRPVDRSRAFAHSLNLPYFRFSTPLKKEVCLDETDNACLIQALWQTMEYMHEQSHEIDDLISLLA